MRRIHRCAEGAQGAAGVDLRVFVIARPEMRAGPLGRPRDDVDSRRLGKHRLGPSKLGERTLWLTAPDGHLRPRDRERYGDVPVVGREIIRSSVESAAIEESMNFGELDSHPRGDRSVIERGIEIIGRYDGSRLKSLDE